MNYPNFKELLRNNSPLIKGVVYNLTKNNYATKVNNSNLQPGDIVQFWTESWGHCGVFVKYGKTKNTVFLYSSMPMTNFSSSEFSITSKFYACRIKNQYLKH